MSNFLLYIIGFLIGIFLLLMIISDNGDFTKLFKNTREYFASGEQAVGVIKYEDTEIVKVPVVPQPSLKEITGKADTASDDPETAVIQNSDIIDNYKLGRTCGSDDVDIVNGRLTGMLSDSY